MLDFTPGVIAGCAVCAEALSPVPLVLGTKDPGRPKYRAIPQRLGGCFAELVLRYRRATKKQTAVCKTRGASAD